MGRDDVSRGVPRDSSFAPRTSPRVRARVGSAAERLSLQVGTCRRLDDAPLDRRVFLGCAACFTLRPRKRRLWLTVVARMIGIPEHLVWEVLARHELFDDDAWVALEHVDIFAEADLSEDDGYVRGFYGARLSLPDSQWAFDFLAVAARRWPEDLAAVTADLVVRGWAEEKGRITLVADFLGHVFECVEPEWWMGVYLEGVRLGRGNLTYRADRMPMRRTSRRVQRRATAFRPLSDEERTHIRSRLGRAFIANGLGDIPERAAAASPCEMIVAGRLLCTLYRGGLPGVAELLEDRLFAPEMLFDFLAELEECSDTARLEAAAWLLYDMITGTEGGPRRFVEALRARRGWDLPRPLRRAVVERLSMGLGAVVEVADTAEPGLGAEVLAVIRTWRDELGRLSWSQTVGRSDSNAGEVWAATITWPQPAEGGENGETWAA